MYEYRHAGRAARLVRRTAATRPMARLYARIQPPLDRWADRLSGGRTTVSSLLSGLPVTVLTTTGARSGRERSRHVLAVPADDGLVVVASNYGRPHHPAWYHNLRAHPRASVVVDGVSHEVEARELDAEERDEAFALAAAMYPGFHAYGRWAAPRRIPVLRLDPVRRHGSRATP